MRLTAGLMLASISLLSACASMPEAPQGYSTALTLWASDGECDFTLPDRARLRAVGAGRDFASPPGEGADRTWVVRDAELRGRLLRGTYCLSVARGRAQAAPDSTYGFTIVVGARTDRLEVRPSYASVRTPEGPPLRVHLSLGAAPLTGIETGPESIVAFDLGRVPTDGVSVTPEVAPQRLTWPRSQTQPQVLRLVAVVRESTNPDAPGPVSPDLVRQTLSEVDGWQGP